MRQALIHVSENVCKPKYGRDYFGKLAANRIRAGREIDSLACKNIVFSDGGFVEEVLSLVDIDDVVVVRLKGRGSFLGDSRSYLNAGFSLDLQLVEDQPQKAVIEILEYLA